MGEIAADDAILWLWTTNAHLPHAFGIVEAWGFTYKTLLTWVKNRIGLGDWLRGQTEHCLMSSRGHPRVILMNQSTGLFAPVREHSRKPEEFYTLVRELCPGPRLDMFSREPHEGFEQWGNEVGKFARSDPSEPNPQPEGTA